MNVVFVSKECPPSPHSCGIGTYVWETGRALAQRGHNVTIIAASDSNQSSSATPSPGLTVIRLPDDELDVDKRGIVSRALRAPLEQGIAYRRRVSDCIATLIKGDHPDIVEFPGFRGESAMWLAERHAIPMVVRMHGSTAGADRLWRDHISATKRLQMGWERQEMRAADIITVVSEQQATAVRSRFGADRVKVVHNSIDSDYWRMLSDRASQEIGTSDLLFVGSLLWKKGIFVLLRAARILRKSGWRGRLFLAGRTTPEFERSIRLCPDLGMRLPEWTVRLGVCRREQLAGLYRDAGACCFPSIIEAFSYTCLEAMACGGVAIGSLGTGMAEVLDEQSGFLVPPGDASRLAVAIKSALSMSEDERRRMKEAAQQRARDRFDHGVIMPRLLDVYRSITKCRSPRGEQC